jgi:hypothetical protein
MFAMTLDLFLFLLMAWLIYLIYIIRTHRNLFQPQQTRPATIFDLLYEEGKISASRRDILNSHSADTRNQLPRLLRSKKVGNEVSQ